MKKVLSLKKLLIIESVLLTVICVFLFQIESSATQSLSRRDILQKVDYIQSSTEDYSDLVVTISTEISNYHQSEVRFLAYLEDRMENFDSQMAAKALFPNDKILINQDKAGNLDYSIAVSSKGTEYAVISDDVEKWPDLEDMENENFDAITDILESNDLFLLIDKTGKILYSSAEELDQKTVDELGFGIKDLPVDDAGWLTIQGEKYYTASQKKFDNNFYYVVALKSQTINTNNRIAAALICMVIWFISILTITYYYFLCQEHAAATPEEQTKKAYSHPSILCILAVIAIGFATLHIQSLFGLSVYSIQKSDEANHIQAKSEILVENLNGKNIIYSLTGEKKSDAIASAVQMYPELNNQIALREIRDLFDFEFVEIYDIDENLQNSSKLYKNQYVDWSEQKLFEDNAFYFISKQSLSFINETMNYRIRSPIYENGEPTAFVRAGLKLEPYDEVKDSMRIDSFIKNIPVQKGNEIICIDTQNSNVIYSSITDYNGTNISNLGIPDTALKNDSFLSLDLEGQKYFSTCTTMDRFAVLLLSPSDNVFEGRAMISFIVMLTCAIMLGALIMLVSRSQLEPLPVDSEQAQEEDIGKLSVSEWIHKLINKRRKRDAEDRVMAIARFVYRILSLLVLGIVLFRGALYRDSTIFGFLVNGRWEKGFNIFAITAVIVIVFVYSVIMSIVLYLFKKLISIVNPKSETILRLIRSFSIYGSALAVAFYCMNLLGMDSQSLLASAGLMGFVISWGAKDMITDILAGLFIIFENQFQVGETIEVNGEKGRVLEIGLRTTRLINQSSNTRIISNRSLTNVVNKSRYPANGSVTIYISYNQDLTAVEQMLSERLPKLENMDPNLLSGPIYLGVTDYGEQSIRLLISFKSEEKYRFGISTRLCSEIYKMFKEQGFKLGIDPQDIKVSQDEI